MPWLVMALAIVVSFAGAAPALSGPDTPLPNIRPSSDWEHVSGWVERVEGDRVSVRRRDGRLVVVDVGRLAVDVRRVLRLGRDVVMYGRQRPDGIVIARGLALDYDAEAAPAASPRGDSR